LRKKLAHRKRLFKARPLSKTAEKGYTTARNSYFHAIREAKTDCWNNFLENAQGKEIFTALRYTKAQKVRKIPNILYKDANGV
jgi:hypothetical protein